MRPGANYLGYGKCEFTVWAPEARQMEVSIISPESRIVQLNKRDEEYWYAEVENVYPGTLYKFRIDNSEEWPDPSSYSQPEGVHGPSEVCDHKLFKWTDEKWTGLQLTKYIIYELHTGTFTKEGTFDAVIPRLDYLKDLGVTAVEIMPVSQFPGNRNWGYDGVYPYAPQNSYGGIGGLKTLVDLCHAKGLAVILDVVYNHFGPEGNYLSKFGPYFTSKYRTPWGPAINYDDEFCDGVRNYFIENALYWLKEYHIDALRLDAIHSIYDFSARHILAEMSEKVEDFYHETNIKKFLIAESDLNDVKVVRPLEQNGYGCDAQWADDFHHALHAMLTGESSGYYRDFGKTGQMVDALKNSYVYSGEYSEYRKRRFGNSAAERPTYQFVVFTQNHDQIGNRAFGSRLSQIVSFEALKLAAGTMLLSPYLPLIFMGEEYGETAPFLYFVSHTDQELVSAVQKGRKEEFSDFQWQGDIPDPQSEQTFNNSKLNWNFMDIEKHKALLNFYKQLIRLRGENSALMNFDRANLEVSETDTDKVIYMRRWNRDRSVIVMLNFNEDDSIIKFMLPDGKKKWYKLLDSADAKWMGRGSEAPEKLNGKQQEIKIKGRSFLLYESEESI